MFLIASRILSAVPLFSLAAASILPARQLEDKAVSQDSISFASDSQGSVSSASGIEPSLKDCKHCYHCFSFLAPPGSKFLSFIGKMIVPNNSPDNSQATNLLYPGLLDSKDVVLQTVLEGLPQDKGHWTTFQNRLIGGPYNESGNSVRTSISQELNFFISRADDGKSFNITAAGAHNNYPIKEDMTEARLCGEFLKSNWNFGELVFEGVQIIASGKDGSFCKAGGQKTIGAAKGKWEGVAIGDDLNGNTVCTIKKLTMSVNG